jgi:hypothetical protein
LRCSILTGSLAAAGLKEVDNRVYVRYSYDEEADIDADQILWIVKNEISPLKIAIEFFIKELGKAN